MYGRKWKRLGDQGKQPKPYFRVSMKKKGKETINT
jgi:hypothetical protein